MLKKIKNKICESYAKYLKLNLACVIMATELAKKGWRNNETSR
jgi:hypothetical protein